jgi:hypothetical protein
LRIAWSYEAGGIRSRFAPDAIRRTGTAPRSASTRYPCGRRPSPAQRPLKDDQRSVEQVVLEHRHRTTRGGLILPLPLRGPARTDRQRPACAVPWKSSHAQPRPASVPERPGLRRRLPARHRPRDPLKQPKLSSRQAGRALPNARQREATPSPIWPSCSPLRHTGRVPGDHCRYWRHARWQVDL